jgi:predicted O-methyltransferase YrrM
VEIGSFKGRSTACLAFGIRGTGKHVFAIDTFEGNEKDFKPNEAYGGKTYFVASFYESFLANLERNGLSSYVTPLRAASSEVGKTWDKPIHFLFIDGGHEYEDVLADFQTFYPHVVPGGLVAFHDVHDFAQNHGPVGYPGVLKVWQEVASPLLSDRSACATLAFGRKPRS